MNSLGQNVIIRDIRVSELKMLEDFLYEAIFIPEGYDKPVPHDIIYQPELYSFIEDFGTQPDDHCLVAEVDGNLVGAVWCRIANNYGHVDNTTPNLAISLYKEYRSNGIGTRLMTTMLEKLKNINSLFSFQCANRAYSDRTSDVGIKILCLNHLAKGL